MAWKHERFALNLTELLRRDDCSQSRLARKLGTHQQTVNRWCSGQMLPSLTHLAQIRRVLGCTWDDLLGPKGEMLQ